MRLLDRTSCLPNRMAASVNYNTRSATNADNGHPCTYDGTNDKPVSPAHCQSHSVRKPRSIFGRVAANLQPYILKTKKLHAGYESKPNSIRKEAPYECTMMVIIACDLIQVSLKSSHPQDTLRKIHRKRLTVNTIETC